MVRKPTIDEYVDAIIAKDAGMPYSEVLDAFDLTSAQFFYAAWANLERYAMLSNQDRLQSIVEDPDRKLELLNMGEDVIIGQYNALMSRNQRRLYKGTLLHPENRKTLVYHALTHHHPNLSSNTRKEVIDTIKQLPLDLAQHLFSLRLNSLMQNVDKKGSPLCVLQIFDTVYREITGDSSIFDLTQQEHLHEWGDNFMAPSSYWQNAANISGAVHHMLTEANSRLGSSDRSEVIEAMNQLPDNLGDYFHSLGLAGLMMRAPASAKTDSPMFVLDVFNATYQDRTGDVSLFDLGQPVHLHKWSPKLVTPDFYKDPQNISEAVYHTLTEDKPILGLNNRGEIVKTVTQLPDNLANYLYSVGLGGILASLGKSPLAVFEVFDGEYQRRTQNPSLFDLTQEEHIHKWRIVHNSPTSYWSKPAIVEETIYHTLTENNPRLLSSDRDEVIDAIRKLPAPLAVYFHSIKLAGLMLQAFKGGKRHSPKAVLEVFDKVYQREKGNPSLFDKKQQDYLKFNRHNDLIR